jgi:iron complex outermembrane receptor protein
MHTDTHEHYSRTDTLFLSTSEALPWGYGVNHFGETSANYALYGEMNFNLAPRLRAFLGYREIWDEVSYFTDRVGNATIPGLVFAVAPDFAGSGSHGAQGWAGRTGVQWDLAPEVMGYATVSRGYKGPAYNVFFNMQAFNTNPVNPERSNAYEVGVKSWIWDRRIRLDAAAFDTQIYQYQAALTQEIVGSLVTSLVNAGSAVTRGFDLSLAATPTSRLTYSLDGQYDDAHVGSFVCQPAVIGCSLSGNMLPYAPRWRVDASQDYRYPLTHTLDLDANVAYRWQSPTDFQFFDTPDLIQPSYGIWDLSIGLRDAADRWSTWLVVKNVLDKNYSSYLANGDLGGVLRWVPRDAHRYVGINAQIDF